jgi:hypothetical protein
MRKSPASARAPVRQRQRPDFVGSSSAALEPLTAGIGTFAPGGSLTIDKTLATP